MIRRFFLAFMGLGLLPLSACDTTLNSETELGTGTSRSSSVDARFVYSPPEYVATMDQSGRRGAASADSLVLATLLNADVALNADGTGTILMSVGDPVGTPWESTSYETTGLLGPSTPSEITFNGTDLTVHVGGEAISKPLPPLFQQARDHQLMQVAEDEAYVPVSKNYAAMSEEEFIQDFTTRGYEVQSVGGTEYEISRSAAGLGTGQMTTTSRLDKATMEVLYTEVYRDGDLRMRSEFEMDAAGERSVHVTMYPRGSEGHAVLSYDRLLSAPE